MRLVIMQPYLFPYVGYYQLIAASDHFVIYDDVNYIKQGWINRNNILSAGKPMMFSAPLEDQSSFRLICETMLGRKNYVAWKTKFLRTLQMNYSKAPFFNPAFALVEQVLNSNAESISQLAHNSLQSVCSYAGIPFDHSVSSQRFSDTKHLSGADRVKAICKKTGAGTYINSPGGMELYDKEDFKKDGIELFFLRSQLVPYQQFRHDFVPYLSIIDLMMFNSPQQLSEIIDAYQLT